ncbi:MAG: hypothetical protein KF752_03595 [Pirellulaceae bacterium]|nr:hypothetical protein [Pirellulaceae bacterium]
MVKLVFNWLWIVAIASSAGAHPISLSSAIVDVSPRQLRVELQIMLEDLIMYHGLAADAGQRYAAADLRAAAEKHRQFVLDYFTIRDEQGQLLTATIENVTLDQIDDAGVELSEVMQRSIGFDLVMSLEQEQPQYLTFLQQFGGPDATLPAIMDLYVVRGDIFEESSQLAFGRPHSVELNWNRNLEGRRESVVELRKRRRDQFDARLGIASYAGLYSFLYITRFEVRHEILIPLLTLEQWQPIVRQNADFLEVDEQAAARQAITEYFQSQGRVTINGQVVQPHVSRVNFFGLDIRDFALNAEPRRISAYQGRVGVIVSYPSRQTPSRVGFQWTQFSAQAPFIDAVLMIGNEKPDRFYFHPEATEYHWQGDLVGPQPQQVPANRDLSDSKLRSQVLTAILTNLYRAFDFRHDEDIYDALASGARGPLLREIYLRVKRTLVMAEQGGQTAQATEVVVQSAQPVPGQGDVWDTTWTVKSVSEHWGHLHTRTAQFRAHLKLIQDAGTWKLDQFQLQDEQTLQFTTSIRGYDSN